MNITVAVYRRDFHPDQHDNREALELAKHRCPCVLAPGRGVSMRPSGGSRSSVVKRR